MITSKQRSYLKTLSHHEQPLLQIGKNGLNESLFEQLDKLLEDHELVKINVLKNSPYEMEDLIDEILDETNSEFVQAIGRKLTIYREAEEDAKIELPQD